MVKAFIDWIDEQIAPLGWTRTELMRRAGHDQSVISMIATGQRKPGPALCVNIAKALKVPPETVFRAAGLLPPALKPRDVTDQELLNLFDMLPEDQQDEVLEFVRYKLTQQEKKGNDESRATKANAAGGIPRRAPKSSLP